MTIQEFQNVELRIGTILSAERIEGSDKLLKLQVDLGESGPRQVVAGIGKAYDPEGLVGTQIVVVANLEPRSLMGMESRGMLLAATDEEGNPCLLTVGKKISPGTKIR
jgi:methionyl-tRNA synthetase